MIEVKPDKKFARAYVAQNTGHDFTELHGICEEIEFITTGYDGEEKLMPAVAAGLRDFSPRRDIIVPVGNVYVNLLVGLVAAQMSMDWGYFRVAIYRDHSYHVQNVDINALGEIINVYRTSQPE